MLVRVLVRALCVCVWLCVVRGGGVCAWLEAAVCMCLVSGGGVCAWFEACGSRRRGTCACLNQKLLLVVVVVGGGGLGLRPCLGAYRRVVRACLRACVRACVRACLRACVHVQELRIDRIKAYLRRSEDEQDRRADQHARTHTHAHTHTHTHAVKGRPKRDAA